MVSNNGNLLDLNQLEEVDLNSLPSLQIHFVQTATLKNLYYLLAIMFLGSFVFLFIYRRRITLKRKLSILLLVFLLLGGGYFVYQAVKIDIKAKVAQILLNHSWNKSLERGEATKTLEKF